MSKSILRKALIKKRKLNYSKKKFIKISKFFKFLNNYNLTNKTIAGYYPVNYEIDDLNILKELERKNIKISLPVIKKNYDMDFYSWNFNDPLVINNYGIPEPFKKKIVQPDILFVPLLAFDKRFYRLGYGGGFYDRYIEKLSKVKKFLTIGLAFSHQKIVKIPNNKYDKKLNVIITEKNIYK